MSQSTLQLLLHEGELQFIVNTIEASRKHLQKAFVGGCLFGLWRNSLKQPVIQFVTGPGGNYENIEELFGSRYVKSCASILKEQHCLLHLGFWFSGSREDQSKAERICFESKKNVLLCISLRDEQLVGEYIVKKDGIGQENSLFKEDILPDHSSFRKFDDLTREIQQSKDLVSPMYDGQRVRSKTRSLIEDLPSRVQCVEAKTNDKQWYASSEGMEKLQLLFQYFHSEGFTPEMSRDTNTQDMQFGFAGGYSVDFPPNFPDEMPIVRAPSGQKYQISRRSFSGEDVCAEVVRVIADFLRKRGVRQ